MSKINLLLVDGDMDGHIDPVVDVGAQGRGRPLIASILPVFFDFVATMQVVDMKAMFLALEGTEDQQIFKEVVNMCILPKLLPIIWTIQHASEEADALRFLCMYTGINVRGKLPYMYLEEDCRYLIENLRYDDAKKLVETDDLEFDVNVPLGYNGKSIFHLAVERDCLDLVIAMLKHRDVKINLTNRHGYTALHYAVVFDCPNMVIILLNHGADANVKTNSGRDTPLHLAACQKESDCVLPLLMHKGIKVNEANSRNHTPLDRAMLYQSVPNIKLPFVAAVHSPEQLFPPDYMRRRGLRINENSMWKRAQRGCSGVLRNLFGAKHPSGASDSNPKGMNLKEGDADLMLLDALAAAAADTERVGSIPVTSSPGLSPMRLPGIKEEAEDAIEEQPCSTRATINLRKIIKERTILRNTIDQLRGSGGHTSSEILSMNA